MAARPVRLIGGRIAAVVLAVLLAPSLAVAADPVELPGKIAADAIPQARRHDVPPAVGSARVGAATATIRRFSTVKHGGGDDSLWIASVGGGLLALLAAGYSVRRARDEVTFE